jgi:hypothetical protein
VFGLVTLTVATSLAVGGLREALGALVGGAIGLLNFLWLCRTAGWVLGAGPPWAQGRLRRALWLGASGARIGLVGLALGVLIAGGGVGLGGLLASLGVLPVAVIAEGLRPAREG